MSSVAEDMAARLARGEDLGSVAMAVFPPNVRETVKRCAAVTTFDAELYTQVLRSADGPELAELAGNGRVGQVPGTPERYQLESYLRDGGWQSWWADEGMTPGSPTVPPSLARYAEQLADYYREVGQPLEELRALLLADPDRARELFLRLYAAADEQFDLARCQDAIDVLAADDRAHVLPVELARLRNDYQAFLSARSMWATEFHQTARYFSRPEAEGALRRLLAGKRSRVLQIVAAGGMGKTTQLRWFVARHCITRRPSIPCARIDFDVVDPVNALRYPWLLLLEIASQLDQQLPSAPFRPAGPRLRAVPAAAEPRLGAGHGQRGRGHRRRRRRDRQPLLQHARRRPARSSARRAAVRHDGRGRPAPRRRYRPRSGRCSAGSTPRPGRPGWCCPAGTT